MEKDELRRAQSDRTACRNPWRRAKWEDRVMEKRIDELRRAKWDDFRATHGMPDDAPFVGDPRKELIEELLDALNYLDEIEKTEAAGYIARFVYLALEDALRRWGYER